MDGLSAGRREGSVAPVCFALSGLTPRMVRRTLMRRSQEQPVMNAAAAGGKRIATRMRRMSEDLTIVTVVA